METGAESIPLAKEEKLRLLTSVGKVVRCSEGIAPFLPSLVDSSLRRSVLDPGCRCWVCKSPGWLGWMIKLRGYSTVYVLTVPGLGLPLFVLYPEHMVGHLWVTGHLLLLSTSLVSPPGLETSAVVLEQTLYLWSSCCPWGNQRPHV